MMTLPDGFNFRELNAIDVPDVLHLIKTHNHDDYECAVESYSKSLNDQFILTRNNEVAGVTGFRRIPNTQKAAWLSWSYLEPYASIELKNRGILFDLICEKLREGDQARKVFAMISPTVDSGLGGGHSYGGALASYEDYGFQTELTHRDYYDKGESMTVLSHRISATHRSRQPLVEPREVGIFDSDEIAETDDAYYLEWDFVEGAPLPVNGVEHWIETVRGWEGRVVFIGVPSNAEHAIRELIKQGFTRDGVLTDFYEDGLDEVRLRFDL